jgi:hypothetical protein
MNAPPLATAPGGTFPALHRALFLVRQMPSDNERRVTPDAVAIGHR